MRSKTNSSAALAKALPLLLVYLRGPFLLNNLVALILAFVVSSYRNYWYSGAEIHGTLGGFLLASFFFNLLIIALGIHSLQRGRRQQRWGYDGQSLGRKGFIQLPLSSDGSIDSESPSPSPSVEYDLRRQRDPDIDYYDYDRADIRRRFQNFKISSPWILILDLLFSLALFILFVLVLAITLHGEPIMKMFAAFGALVASVMHITHFIVGLYLRQQEKRRKLKHDPRCPRCSSQLLRRGRATTTTTRRRRNDNINNNYNDNDNALTIDSILGPDSKNSKTQDQDHIETIQIGKRQQQGERVVHLTPRPEEDDIDVENENEHEPDTADANELRDEEVLRAILGDDK